MSWPCLGWDLGTDRVEAAAAAAGEAAASFVSRRITSCEAEAEAARSHTIWWPLHQYLAGSRHKCHFKVCKSDQHCSVLCSHEDGVHLVSWHALAVFRWQCRWSVGSVTETRALSIGDSVVDEHPITGFIYCWAHRYISDCNYCIVRRVGHNCSKISVCSSVHHFRFTSGLDTHPEDFFFFPLFFWWWWWHIYIWQCSTMVLNIL